MKRSRALLAIAPIALVASLLTACSSGGSDRSTEGCLPEGKIAKSIELKGEFGEQLEITSKTPIEAAEIERSLEIKGKGDAVKSGDSIDAQFSIFKGSTGEQLSSERTTLDTSDGALLPWASKVLNCTVVGDRVVATAPVAEVIGEGNAPQLGLEETETLVLVFDVVAFSEPAEEAPEECKELTPRDKKYPEVDLGDGSGEPKITIPECMEAPTELEIEVLKEGTGAVVAADQKIMTNYVGVDWNGAVRFDGNWSKTGIEFSTAKGALIEGFTQAMVGQKIGSIVLVTMPPELGYNDGMTRTFVLELVSAV